MDIDPYAPCPGGTGKKLKFCCTDLTADLDKLSRMISGEQREAALDLVDKLDAKYPDRACLLSTKAMLESELGQPEKAAATVARFREKHPDNPVALAETAILQARQSPRCRRSAATGLRPGTVATADAGLRRAGRRLHGASWRRVN